MYKIRIYILELEIPTSKAGNVLGPPKFQAFTSDDLHSLDFKRPFNKAMMIVMY